MTMDRRQFTGAFGSAIATAGFVGLPSRTSAARSYSGPNVVVVRFGGGVRRRETIQAGTTFAPVLLNVLAKRGVLMPNMVIDQLDGVDTSHAEGTVNILTGRYRAYRRAATDAIGDDLEPTEPTLFEYFRRAFDVPAHQTLLINGEDRPQEEFLSYGVHASHGVAYRSEVLSLYRYKLWKVRNKLLYPTGTDEELAAAQKELRTLETRDYRGAARKQAPEIDAMWARWQQFYGDSGLINPRGDAALTELAIWALEHLRPRLIMINYQDPDYVHWGNASHYTRAIAAIDRDLQRLVAPWMPTRNTVIGQFSSLCRTVGAMPIRFSACRSNTTSTRARRTRSGPCFLALASREGACLTSASIRAALPQRLVP